MENNKTKYPSKAPDIVRNYNINYYNKNKEIILSQAMKKVVCEQCGREMNFNYLPVHIKKNRCKNNKLKK